MEGQDFIDVNQVLQRAVVHKNRAKDHKSFNQFKENNSREWEKHNVNCADEESPSDSEAEICVAESVDTLREKPISCSFMKPNTSKRDEMKFTFDVSKFDKLFDVLVRGGVIRLVKGHVIPTAENLPERKYCKWHDSYSHNTIPCNYFHQ
jgi:hypothetical protein